MTNSAAVESAVTKPPVSVDDQRAIAAQFVQNHLVDLCKELSASAAAGDGVLKGAKLHELRGLCSFAASSAQALAMSMTHAAALRSVAGAAQAKAPRNIGGSLLPSSDARILRPMPGRTGTFQVRALPELDTHGLFHDTRLLVTHANGYSCHSLAERILTGKIDHALEQFDYILACGGLGVARATIEELTRPPAA